ncbi:MAG: hypothetical protein RLN86_10085 [Cyclobacteriaceae bacterium]
MRFFLLFIICSSVSLHGIGQLKKVAELDVDNLKSASVDRLGNFYLLFHSGIIQKLDPNGELLEETKEPYTDLALLEPWNPLSVFLYNANKQSITYLDHHLNAVETFRLEPSLSISPKLVCPDNLVNKIWIYDDADHTIKKIDQPTSTILVDEPLPSDWIQEKPNIIFMREYQNMVFLLDQGNSIIILNSLGLPITRIKTDTRNFFNFNGEELCYLQGESLLLWDLHTGDARTVTKVSAPDEVRFMIITDERLLIVREQIAEILALKI